MADQLYTPEIAKTLPDLFADGSSITKVAAVKLGISRQTYYEWKEKHPEFRDAANKAEQIAESYHEDLMLEGIKGKIDGYNGSSHIFTLKSRFRDTYGEQKQAPNALSAIEALLNLANDKPAR